MNDWKEKAAVLKKSLRLHLYEALYQLPPTLRDIFIDDCILSGSSISSVYHGESVNDFDLYARESRNIDAIRVLIEKSFPDIIEEYDNKYKDDNAPANKKLITANAITLKGKTQFITLGDYQTIRKTFDLKHCLPYYDLKEDKLYISESQMQIIHNKHLVYNGNNVKVYRLEKFKTRGWKIV